VLETDFPYLDLEKNYRVTSGEDLKYNCIAWAYGEHGKWFWPIKRGFWPANVPREETIEAFIELFASIGYQRCDDISHEPEYEKVAIYALNGIPTHAARQKNNGKWTSKLGVSFDIEHDTLECLNGPLYGNAIITLKRKIVNS